MERGSGGFFFVGRVDMEGLESEQEWGTWCEIPKEAIKITLNKENISIKGN